MTLRAHAQLSDFDHSALIYHSEHEYVDWLVRFISEGLDRAQPVLVAVPGDRLASLRRALGDAVADLILVATELATNSLDHAGGACRLAFWY
jgi:MEDS: MEthanogen/methylotroph, DcmR Sensory domain